MTTSQNYWYWYEEGYDDGFDGFDPLPPSESVYGYSAVKGYWAGFNDGDEDFLDAYYPYEYWT